MGKSMDQVTGQEVEVPRRKALVTGSAGFIGQRLIRSIRGYEYTLVDPAHACGITLQEWVRKDEAKRRFDLVVHLASNIESIDRRMAGGAEQFADCEIDLAMMRYIQEYPPGLYVHMSSSVVSFPEPDDPYTAVKRFGEEMALHTCKRAGIPVLIFRPFSGYGEEQSLMYPFPSILHRAMRRENPLIVWGSLYTVRDFIHVDDIVRAIQHGIAGHFPYGHPIELGTGVGTTMAALAKSIADAVGYSPTILADTGKPAGASVRIMTSDLAARHGFKPGITLAEGIERSLSWHGC